MPRSPPKILPPYDSAALERAALDYAARYATTRAKLAAYLRRKLRERGWTEAGAPPVDALVERFALRGYVDDRAFARARADTLLRRGYGGRRIGSALRAAGIASETVAELDERIGADAEAAVMRFARRKRIGPFAEEPADPARKRRWFAAMIRAGHPTRLVYRVLDIAPEDVDIEAGGVAEDDPVRESE
jgi:regulatory protein